MVTYHDRVRAMIALVDWQGDPDLIAWFPWQGNAADDASLFNMIYEFADQQYAGGNVGLAREVLQNMSKYGMGVECTISDDEIGSWYAERHAQLN